MYVCRYVCMYVGMYVCRYVGMYIPYIYIFVCIYHTFIYLYIYTIDTQFSLQLYFQPYQTFTCLGREMFLDVSHCYLLLPLLTVQALLLISISSLL